jgi:hypothetical protein
MRDAVDLSAMGLRIQNKEWMQTLLYCAANVIVSWMDDGSAATDGGKGELTVATALQWGQSKFYV